MEPSALRIRLLGDFELRQSDEALVPMESARMESMLAYLLLHRDAPQPRARVAFLLWPDSTEAQARTNLRHVLHNLRRALPAAERYLDVTTRTLRWRPDAPVSLDVAVFEAALERAGRKPDDLAALTEAVDAYSGDLLAGRNHDEWVLQERERLRQRYVGALERLVARLERRGDVTAAIAYAERLRHVEPLREATYRLLMRLHDARGDRARALRVYHECAATLERELAVEPAPETRAAYEALLPRDDTEEPSRVGGAPFVGRFAERSRLTAAWRAASTGTGHAVLLTGEPGVGKTRLAEEFRAWCAHRGASTATATSYASEGALAYGPLISWLRADTLTARVRRVARDALVELSRLLPELRAEVPGLPRPERLPEDEQRRRLYDAVARVLRGPGQAVVLVADDLQWWDRETLQVLHYLVRVDAAAPLLVVGTARREDVAGAPALRELLVSLHAADRLTEIELDRLGQDETALLAERLTRSALSKHDAAALHAQTEGNPLFVVEAMRAGWHPGGHLLTPKVQAVIESRLAQLSPTARALVDLAATVGREFTAQVLMLAGHDDEASVVNGLDELWRRRIVREHNTAAYDFSHDTIREVAYEALSPIRRRYLHGRVAQALEQAYAHDLDAIGGHLARHYEEAGALERAVAAYARAADVAQRVYAHSESVRLLSRALDLLRALPATAERSARELHLTTALLAPLVAGEGYASPRIHDAHQRALTLARSLGVEPAPPLLRSLGLGSLARGDFVAARGFGTALRERGDRDDDDVLRVEGEYVLGVAAFWAGELTEARTHLERAVATYRDANRREHVLRYAQDPKVICLTRLALTYWFLGDAEAAVRARDEGLAVAEQVGHPYSLATGLLFASLLALDMHDEPGLRRFVDRAKTTLREETALQIEGAIAALDAYLGVLDGRSADGIAHLRQIVASARLADQAAPGHRSALLRILLAACEAAGDVRTGLTVADELLALTNSKVWRPEAQRLRAKFLAMRPATA